MRLITIILFITSLLYSKNFKSDDCSLFFKEIGVKDFQLGLEYKTVILDFKVKPEKTKLPNGNEVLVYKEQINLLNKKRTVVYDLTFKDNKLIGYTFKIRVENSEYGLNYFEKILKKASKKQ